MTLLFLILSMGLPLFRADARGKDMHQGDWLLYNRRYSEAITMWKRALEESPDDVDLLLRLGVALSLEGKHAEAEAAFERALRVEPEDAKVIYNLGLLYLKQGQDERALRCLRRTLELVGWYPEANYHIGLVYEKRGLKDKALQFYVQEVNNNPACAGAWRRIFALRAVQERREVPTGTVVMMLGVAGLALYWLRRRKTGP
ncbi:MAG TPA: tetratricopeptide repeat protein [Candidatus Latescibacteria bacterium]|nr:tetratricopeptide repeat protein [Candidatus Latescibacterota bacterium]